MSPLRSSAGPATARMPTPSSSRTMCASVVLPSPGGPTSSTWSSASPRAFAASSAIAICSFTRSWPTNSSRRRGRSVCSNASSSSTATRREELRAHAALRRRGRARAPRRTAPGSVVGERALGVGDRVAELDESVARNDVRVVRRRGRCVGADDAELLLQLEHDPLGRLLPDPGNRDEARRVLAHDRAAQLLRRRAGDDRERDLRADAVHREQLDEELALGAVGEAVQLEHVLAHVEIRLDRHLVGAAGLAHDARRRGDEVADAADVENEPFERRSTRPACPGASRRRSPSAAAIFMSGGASAWQIATASASAAWFGVGSASSPRIAFTMRCTCAFSARP